MLLVQATDKISAQQRVDRIHAFEEELAELDREGILALDAEQRRSVEDYHRDLKLDLQRCFDIDATTQAKQLSLAMRIASFLGALALSASVFFLFYQFWGLLGTTSQVCILVAASVTSFIATVAVAGKDTSGYFVKLVGLVAFACFVLNLVMLGLIFNITPSDYALLAWAALALLIAYAYDLRLLLLAGIACVIAFVSARVGSWNGIYWIYIGQRPENFLPVGIALFLIPLWIGHRRYPGFSMTYRLSGMVAMLLPILVLGHWGNGSYLSLDPDIVEGFYQLAGFTASAGFTWLGIRRGWNHVVNTGVVFFVIFLYTKFFDWWWELMPKYLFFLVLGLAALLCLVILKRLRKLEPATAEGGAGT